MLCRQCQKEFEQEGFEVFCSPDCTAEFNSGSRERTVNRPEAPTVAAAKIVAEETCGWSEEEFQEAVCRRAEELGWKWFHVRNTRKSKAGWFDLVLWRDRVIFAELKDETGVATADQLNFQDDFKSANAEVYLWRPSDWSLIESILSVSRDAKWTGAMSSSG